jgi:5-amino-6-(5-phosphoribosylamino)uracil reductase
MSTGEWRQRVGDEATLSGWLQELPDGGAQRERAVAVGRGQFRRPSDHETVQGFPPEELAADLRRHRLEDADRVRPYVMANLALAADGRLAADPHAAGALEPGATVEDVARAEVDAVLIGAGVLRSGRYARALARPELREHRRGLGLTRDPLGIVIARSGALPHDLAIAANAESPLVLYTTISDPPVSVPAGVEVARMAPHDLTPAAALAHARRERGVRSVLYEGGSAMLAALLAAHCVDELFITVDTRLTPDPDQPPAPALPGLDRPTIDGAWQDDTRHATLLRLRPALSTA